MKAEYKPEVLQGFADELYSRARSIAIAYTLGYGVLGAIVAGAGLALAARIGGADEGSLGSTFLTGAVFGALLFGFLGWAAGDRKAFAMRLEAQRTLCQLQIEKNTRAQ